MNAPAAPDVRVAKSLSGKELAAAIRTKAADVTTRMAAGGVRPRLAVVVATDDGASLWYVRSIARAAERAGIHCDLVELGADAEVCHIRATLAALSADEEVHGIILQTPLPAGATLPELASAIDPEKDVDGANPVSLGRISAGRPAFAPATAAAVIAILDHHEVELAGRNVVILGRSTVVGIPVAQLLLARHSTVTVCHSRTPSLAEHTTRADVLVVAVGRPGLVTGEHLATGSTVIDVGTNPTDDGGLVGDVDAQGARHIAAALTPVPGGVGPVTTALLLQHTVQAAEAMVRNAG